MRTTLPPILAIVLALLLGACASTPSTPPAPAPTQSLYDKVGGQPAIEKLVDALVAQYKADPRIANRFNLPAEDMAYLRERLIEQLCQATGGPCEYTGLPMDEAHSSMAISEAEFDAFMQDTNKAMTQIGIGDEDQLTIVGVLESMRGDVVNQ